MTSSTGLERRPGGRLAGPGAAGARAVPPAESGSGEPALPQVRGSSRWAAYLVLGGILILATALRLYGLGSWAFEQDELYTLRGARDLQFNVRPLYYVVVHLLLAEFPPTELVLRAPAFVFGVLGVLVTWLLGRQVFGYSAAHVAAVLVTLSPWHLYLSQYARYYSLVYLLAALTLLLLLRAVDRDSPGAYLAALVAIVLGCLSHPSFAFPLAGEIVAVHLITRSGGLRRPLLTRNGVLYLWAPLFASGLFLYALLVRLGGGLGALSNGDGRSLRGVLLQLAAIVEGTTPELVVAGAAGAVFLLVAGGSSGGRRWGALALLGCCSGIAVLVASASWADVYADYATALLPLVFVTAGGFACRVAELLRAGQRVFVPAILLVLAAALLPGTVSHLSDGTRYDFRPAYAHITATGTDHLVVAWPAVLQQHYAPGLRLDQLLPNPEFLTRTLRTSGNFWLIGRYNRFGLMSDGGGAERWISANCREVLHTQRPRLDFRSFRIELHWCGAGDPHSSPIERSYADGS